MFIVWKVFPDKLGWKKCLSSGDTQISYAWTIMTCMRVQSLSRVWLPGTPWTVSHQTALSVGFPRQDYWSGLSFPPPGDLPDPGIETVSLTLAQRILTEPPGKLGYVSVCVQNTNWYHEVLSAHMQLLGNNSVHCSQPIPSMFPSYFNDIYPPPSWKQDTQNIYVAIDFLLHHTQFTPIAWVVFF